MCTHLVDVFVDVNVPMDEGMNEEGPIFYPLLFFPIGILLGSSVNAETISVLLCCV
jgi:hypothetical protein